VNLAATRVHTVSILPRLPHVSPDLRRRGRLITDARSWIFGFPGELL
jgi:hypothetical protein